MGPHMIQLISIGKIFYDGMIHNQLVVQVLNSMLIKNMTFYMMTMTGLPNNCNLLSYSRPFSSQWDTYGS